MNRSRIRAGGVPLAVLLLAAGYFAGCAPASNSHGNGDRQTIVISAAASTKEAIEELARAFERSAKVEVQVNLGSSSSLAAQIVEGAPADLFLSANERWADELGKSGLAATSTAFLTNQLVIVTPQGNPAGIESPEDLMNDGVSKVALAGEEVPAGQYAEEALTKLRLLAPLEVGGKIARGQDVRSALAYVERGEVEAGIVYATDAALAENVEIACEIDPALHERIVYVLVLVERPGRPKKAADFYRYLLSAEGERQFARRGFSPLP